MWSAKDIAVTTAVDVALLIGVIVFLAMVFL